LLTKHYATTQSPQYISLASGSQEENQSIVTPLLHNCVDSY